MPPTPPHPIHPSQLSPSQLSKAVYMFTTITFDTSLPVAVHTTCIRLLLNLVECIYPLARSQLVDAATKAKGRQLLTRILECLITKVKHLKVQVGGGGRGGPGRGGGASRCTPTRRSWSWFVVEAHHSSDH